MDGVYPGRHRDHLLYTPGIHQGGHIPTYTPPQGYTQGGYNPVFNPGYTQEEAITQALTQNITQGASFRLPVNLSFHPFHCSSISLLSPVSLVELIPRP